MGILNGAGAWLAKKLKTAAADRGSTIVYRRKADAVETDLTGSAWVGDTSAEFRSPTGVGPARLAGHRDYLIPVADLPAEPEEGDWVVETVAGSVTTWELIRINGEPAWRYSDEATRTVYRCHTREVRREAV